MDEAISETGTINEMEIVDKITDLEKKILDAKPDIIEIIDTATPIEGQFPGFQIIDIRSYFDISSEVSDKDIQTIFQEIFSDYIISIGNEGTMIAFRKKPVIISPTEVIKFNISTEINNEQMITLGPSIFELLHGMAQIPVHPMNTILKYGAFKHFNVLEKIIEYMSNRFNLPEKEMIISIYQQLLLREHKYEHILREGTSYHLKDPFTTTTYFKGLVFIIDKKYMKGEIFVIPFLEDEFFEDMDKQLVQVPKKLSEITFNWYYAFRFRLKDVNSKYPEMYKYDLYDYISLHEKIMKDIGITEELSISPGTVLPDTDLRFHLVYNKQKYIDLESFKSFIEDISKLATNYISEGLDIIGYGKIDIEKSEMVEKW